MFQSHLTAAEIQALTDAANAGDVFQFDRQLWLEHIPTGFANTLPESNVRLTRFRLLLARLNAVERLADGSVPLVQFLRNIAALLRLAGLPEEAVFERIATQVGNRTQGVKLTMSAQQVPEVIRKEAIVHQDDTLSIGFLDDALRVSQSVARIVVPRFEHGNQRQVGSGAPWVMKGTGWLISADLFVTNHHVVNARDATEPDADSADFERQGAEATVEFDLNTDKATPDTFSVQKLETADAALDYAVLRLARTTARRPLSMRVDQVTMAATTYLPVNIIQHPRGLPKRIACRNNLMSGADNNTIRYFTDTDFGSSGAPVCDDAWRVIALHRGAERADGVIFQGKDTAFVNFGTQVSTLLEDLKQREKSLYDEIMAAQPV
jgi:endonuclease G, mitochondrial